MKKYLSNSIDVNALIDVLDEVPLWSAPFGLKLLEQVRYKKNITAVDIGFGTGFPLTELALRLGNSSIVYGIDPWKEIIERVQKKIKLYEITNIKLLEGVAEKIPLEDGSVHLIVSNNGINNVTNIDAVFSECERILTPGGQFVFTMNLDLSMFEFYSVFEEVLSELAMHSEIALMKQHIAHKRPPLDIITKLLHQHNFLIEKLQHEQFTYHFADGTTMLNHYFIRLAFLEAWLSILPKEFYETIFDNIETTLNGQAQISEGITLSIPFVVISALRI